MGVSEQVEQAVKRESSNFFFIADAEMLCLPGRPVQGYVYLAQEIIFLEWKGKHVSRPLSCPEAFVQSRERLVVRQYDIDVLRAAFSFEYS